jgi:thymidine kinase
MQGKLRFCYGTMESAKSALLLIEAYNFEKRGIGFLCMKPSVDNRESINYISSRIGIERECLTIYPDFDIYTVIYKMVSERKEDEPVLQWILVDESQFLTTIQVEELRRIVDDFGINVLCYGLRTDFMTNLFDGSKRLFELADDINEMKISCSCGRKAIINARFNENDEIVINGEQVLIGGEDIYKPLCSKCYTEEVKKVLQYI